MAHSGNSGGKQSESASSQQDYGNWTSSGKGEWEHNDIIVDTKDRDAWPSIGDDGERSSEVVAKSVVPNAVQQGSPLDCSSDVDARTGDAVGDSPAWMASKVASAIVSTTGGNTPAWNSSGSTTAVAGMQHSTPAMQSAVSSNSGWDTGSRISSSASSSVASWQEGGRDQKVAGSEGASWQSNGPSPLIATGGWLQASASQSSKNLSMDTWATTGSHWNDATDASALLQDRSASEEWSKNPGVAQANWNKPGGGGQWTGSSSSTTLSCSSTTGAAAGPTWNTSSVSSPSDVSSSGKPGPWSNPAAPVGATKAQSVKPQKLPDTLDAVQAQMVKAINTTESWGKTPVRQETPWLDPDLPEGRKKGEDTNTWNSMPNNGTGIWESLRKNAGGPGTSSWDDKKGGAYGVVSGNDDDPYVWNPASKSKDNAMWDDLPKESDGDVPHGPSSWQSSGTGVPNCSSPSWGVPANNGGRGRNGNPHSSRTASVSSGSGNDTVANGCVADGMTDAKPSAWGSIDDDGLQPPGGSSRQDAGPLHWSASAQGKAPGGWTGATSAGPGANQPQSLQKDWTTKGDASNKLWDQSNASGGTGDWSSVASTSGWSGSDLGKAVRSGPSWDAGHQDWSANRRLRSESDVHGWAEDAEIGEWSDLPRRDPSWNSSAPRRGPMPKHGANPAAIPSKMMNGGQPMPTRQQMIQTLQDMGFPKDLAQKALLENQMDLNRTIADLRSGASQQDSGQLPHMFSSAMSDTLSSSLNPHLPPMHPNTPLMNNAQGFPNSKSLSQVSSSRPHNHKSMQPQQQQQQAFGGGRFLPQMVGHQHQQQVLQNVQYLVTNGLVPAGAVSRPAYSQHIDVMLKTLSTLQALSANVTHMQQQLQQSRPNNPVFTQQVMDSIQQTRSKMETLRMQLLALSKHLNQQMQNQAADTFIGDLSSLSLNPSGGQQSQSQSRLYQWKQPPESDLMSASQPSRAPGSKPIHASFSSPNLHGGLNIGNDTTWSASSSTNNWPTSNSGKSAEASHIESQTSLDSQIQEFVPGQPWQGLSSQKIDEDATITPPSAAKQFLNVNTAGSNGLEQYGLTGAESWPGYGSFSKGSLSTVAPNTATSTWAASATSPIGALGGTADPWNASAKSGLAPSRPPPGLSAAASGKSMGGLNRSISWAPAGAQTWDRPASQWLVIRNLAPQVDGGLLRSLCLNHGQLSNFYLNHHTGLAVIQYNYAQDAVKAQKSLSSCVIANAPIAAELIGEEEVARLLDHGSRQNQPSRSTSMQWLNSSGVSGGGGSQMSAWSSGSNTPAGAPASNMWSGSAMASLDSATGAANAQGFLLPGDLLGASDYSMSQASFP